MKILDSIAGFFNRFTIKLPIQVRIGILSVVGILVIIGLLNRYVFGIIPEEEDIVGHNIENVYLYEEIVYADEIFMKSTGINVIINDNGEYVLNLQMQIEQHNTDINVNQQVISPDMFSLKLVDITAKSPMSVFVESLASATATALISAAVGGEINVIGETLGFASDYASDSIENASASDDIVIGALADSFIDFYPHEKDGETTSINISFILTEEFLQSNKTMVISIDTWFTVEKNIFLVLRPNTQSYEVIYDNNGGYSDLINNIYCNPGEIKLISDIVPQKDGYEFLYWTVEKDNPSTKVRDIYFYTYDSNTTFTLYAYYQEKIPLDDFINLGENITFKDGVYEIAITEYDLYNSIVVLTENLSEIVLVANDNHQFLGITLVINKVDTGNNHELDNSNDFYLENVYVGEDISEYYGYISEFEAIKPIDDYSWIGTEISDVGTYTITLYFEISNEIDVEENLIFLELDFFIGYNSKSVLIRSEGN